MGYRASAHSQKVGSKTVCSSYTSTGYRKEENKPRVSRREKDSQGKTGRENQPSQKLAIGHQSPKQGKETADYQNGKAEKTTGETRESYPSKSDDQKDQAKSLKSKTGQNKWG